MLTQCSFPDTLTDKPSDSINNTLDTLITSTFSDRIQLLRELVSVHAAATSSQPTALSHILSDLSHQISTLESQAADLQQALDTETTLLGHGRSNILPKLKQQESVLIQMLDKVNAGGTHATSTEHTADTSDTSTFMKVASASDTNGEPDADPTSHASKKEKPSAKPCRSIRLLTDDEYNHIPQYIVGRITLEKINQAITDLNLLISDKYKIFKLPQQKMSKLQRSIYWEHKQLATAETKSRVFVTEKDLKDKSGGWTESGFKFDAVGRNVVAILRHLGRIKEVRGGGHTRIVLQ
ncbi:hypothetical protein BDEG_26420 [Batrachochytrium dendrobatidis JEL423]|uniref:Spindle and kinetochore-associated protein 1 n=1 Tax=Batrachochytrium dendrobatidis (strain JEL423) TaxID=403673 RepID=A0A177WT88_BATDL|nr:hypothetical protein BDEG_26420 [Batrachochytrium dendrobatidis JEL423]